MTGRRILVIGRTGQVAQALAERGACSPHSVHLAGRPQCDLTDPASLERALAAGPDVVVNAAAYTAVDAAETDREAAHRLNAEGPTRLAALCAASAIPLIHISTDYVFDGTLDRPYREDDPISPRSTYGRTKAEGEAGVAAAGGPALIVRTAWVYSPFARNFVRTMLRLAANGTPLRVVDDQLGNPTSALDLADALLALAERPRWDRPVDVLNVVSRGETTWYGLACAAFQAAGLEVDVTPIPTAQFPTAAERPANSRLVIDKARHRYGLKLPHWGDSLTEVVRRIRASDLSDRG